MKIIVKYPSNIRTLIQWDNPIAIADGYSVWGRLVNGQPMGQFCMCPVRITDATGKWAGTWAENTLFTQLTTTQLLKIASIQIADAFSVQDKMNALMGYGADEWGAPMRGKYIDSAHWADAVDIRMIGTVYAGQAVEVIAHGNFPDMAGNVVPMSQIRTYETVEWDHPGTWQYVTAVNSRNEPNTRFKGLVKLPIYFGGRQAWVLDRWLEV